jgi:hypothetical protein
MLSFRYMTGPWLLVVRTASISQVSLSRSDICTSKGLRTTKAAPHTLLDRGADIATLIKAYTVLLGLGATATALFPQSAVPMVHLAGGPTNGRCRVRSPWLR